MRTMYEVNWHYKNDVFTHCTVTPVTVEREGVLPGCSKPSITAVDAKGERFQGSAEDFFGSEKDAWANIADQLLKTIESNDKEIENLKNQNFYMHRFLCNIPREHNF